MRIVVVLLAAVFAFLTVNANAADVFPKGTTWKYRLGTSEASTPISAWRELAFDDATWSNNAAAPIGYSDATTGIESTIATRLPTSAAGAYLTVYLRKTFNITDKSKIGSLTVQGACDDGYVVWVNGVELGRSDAPLGDLAFNATATDAAEVSDSTITYAGNAAAFLNNGLNVIAVHLLNANSTSSDLFFDCSLSYTEDLEAPTVVGIFPQPGSTNRSLSTVEIAFSEPVVGLNAADLLINNNPASGVGPGDAGEYIFTFTEPATGQVQVAWAAGHGITDALQNPFVAGPGWTYVLDPNLPVPPVLLNEFMASNDDTLNDEDGDPSDWIELHNPGSEPRSVGGWFLTDAAGNLTKWQFPAGVSIEANGYLVVFASNKDRRNPLGRLHTNFQLGSGGEYLALLDDKTNIISEFAPAFPAQQTDVSYGRDPGDPTLVGFFTTPTPGARNAVGGPGFASEVTFSRESGTFPVTAPFNLVLTTADSNAVIRYVYGTNFPSQTSAQYTGPIQITNTTLIRVRAFVPGKLPGPVTTKSYVALANQPTLLNYSSHLPIVIIHNYGQGVIGNDDRNDRFMLIQTFEPGPGRSSMTNSPNLAEFGTYHARGSSTLNYPKKSLLVELQDEFRDDKEVDFVGMPKESDWVFFAPNNFDPSLFHNPLAMQLANDQGEYASRTKFVEVYYKDDAGTPGAITEADYNGVYVVMEKIKRDGNRVDIARLEREHTNALEVTGGYMFSIDRSNGEPQLGAGGATLNWIEPSGFEMTNAARAPQLTYIRTYLNDFNAALNNNNLWTNPATGYAAYIDVESWARRHIHEVITFNVDALRLSGYFFKDRGRKIEYGPAWDYDRTQGSTDSRDFNPRVWRSTVPDLGTDFFNFTPWWARLFQSPDFWQRWIDQYQDFRENVWSMSNVNNRIELFASQIRPVHAREFARWAVPPRSTTITLGGFTHTFGTNGYENEVRWKSIWYSNRLHFIDTQFLARPMLSGAGGQVFTGYNLTITPQAKPGSTTYYTLDGSDPRLSGGGISPSALSTTQPVSISVTNNVRVFARSWNPDHRNLTGPNNPPISSPWSGAAVATYFTHVPPLRITEIMYHPQDPPSGYTNDGMFEYVEFKNIGNTPLNVNRFTLSGGVDFTFPNAILAGGESAVIVANTTEFQARYGTSRRILGQFGGFIGDEATNQLDNAGERLVLSGPLREPILDFEYDDDWYPITDGFGFSLVIVNDQAPTSSWGLKSSWRPSSAINGSPSQNDPAPPNIPPVVINEALTHSDPAPPTDTVELHNLSGTSSANISGWWLTDDFSDPKKYRIPDATVIAPGGFILFDEGDFNDPGLGNRAFSLSSLGDAVYLFSADVTGELTGYFSGFDFGAAENGRTFGRYVISTGSDQYPPQVSPTLGAANAGPLIGPIVISEIHYHPPDLPYGTNTIDNDLDEFIELHNISAAPAALYHPTFTTNTWRLDDAVDYQFPPGVTIPAGGYLLVVGFNPTNTAQLAAFRTRNNVPAGVPIYGPWSGKLDNSSDSVELRRPDNPEPQGPPNFGLVPYLLVERVRYSDEPPWPLASDGFGPSLQRLVNSAYGNDPANWVAAATSPGGAYGGGTLPVITAQPQDTVVVGYNDTMLSVTAQGPNLRYQWLFEGSIIPGATNSILQLTNVIPGLQEGNYQVLVLNPAGSVASSNAYLNVLVPANITVHPRSQDIRATQSVRFDVVADSATEISYQWYHNGVPIPGATASSYIDPFVEYDDGGLYRVQVTDDVGSIFSQSALLTVLIDPVIRIHPVAQTIASNSAVTLSVEVTNTATLPIGFRWRVGSSGLVSNWLERRFDFFTIPNVRGVSNMTVAVYNASRPAGSLSISAAIRAIPDFDTDGMSDEWEIAYGFATNDISDAIQDADGDGMKNLAEYTAGTNPTNAQSYFSVQLVDVAPGLTHALMRFNAVSNRTYTVQYQNTVGSAWNPLHHVVARATNHVVEVTDTDAAAPSRFYQLVTPRQE